MASLQTTAAPALDPATHLIGENGPWVADLHGSYESGECQSSVGFDSHPCEGTPHWHVELEVSALAAANPHWEGKLCDDCLAGWREWAMEAPVSVRVVSVHPIAIGT